MFSPSICEMWENLNETYSMKKNFTTYYQIESKIFNTKQGTLPISVIKLDLARLVESETRPLAELIQLLDHFCK